MAQYGELLIDTNPQIDLLYGYFDKYFNYPLMIKIKNIDDKSMYICKIKCIKENTNKYIIVFSNYDTSPIGKNIQLKRLQWSSLHTSILPTKYNIIEHEYTPNINNPLKVEINRIKITSEGSTYECNDFPISIKLIPKNYNSNEYNESGNIINALETYSTVVTIID
jgi:hypothetical protein